MLRGMIASLILVSLCAVIHTFGLVMLGGWLIQHPLKLEPKLSIIRYTRLLSGVFAVITLLHLVETAIWAAFYDWQGHFSDFETSWYFSLSSYTTIGYGDVVLPAKWRMLGGVEGITGVLLCGLSGAFLFVILNQMFAKRIQLRDTRSK